MWLLPAFSTIARLALRLFYRLRIVGAEVPRGGPVLLVANHPNSLLDPAAVVAAARRPVRFLAKAPLFTDRQVGWLVRGAGAIPVYRRADDPSQVERNRDSFEAVFEALRGGAAVGIFPEGISHSEPSLVPLKTGAARIALGGTDGEAFPLVPLGLSLRDKRTFRSEALVVVGEPVEWSDLAARGPDDAPAVRELTARIDAALRGVTLNLQSWEDAPLVEVAQQIYLAESRAEPGPAGPLAGLQEVAEGLAALRARGDSGWSELAREVAEHEIRLRALHLRPAQLGQPGPSAATRWVARSALLSLIVLPVLAAGTLAFYVPYRLVGEMERRGAHTPDVAATFKLLTGGAVYLGWIALIATVGGVLLGPWGAAAALAALPLLGLATIRAREWRRGAAGALRRYLARRRRAEHLRELEARQSAIADRLTALREELGR